MFISEFEIHREKFLIDAGYKVLCRMVLASSQAGRKVKRVGCLRKSGGFGWWVSGRLVGGWLRKFGGFSTQLLHPPMPPSSHTCH